MENLVYAECSLTFDMLEDRLITIISDTGVFVVTTESNSKNYDELFYPVSKQAIVAYNIHFKNGCLVSESYPSEGK